MLSRRPSFEGGGGADCLMYVSRDGDGMLCDAKTSPAGRGGAVTRSLRPRPTGGIIYHEIT